MAMIDDVRADAPGADDEATRASAARRYTTAFVRGPFHERINLFSDAVFAIAMTLLVIELHAPEVPAGELPEALLELVSPYLAFVLSFVVIGLAWLSHFRKMRVVARFDPMLLRLNLLMLLFVASLPLPTAILGLHGDSVLAVVIYAASVSALGFTLAATWVYVWRAGLTDATLDRALFRLALVKSLPVPIVFLLSIPVALLWGATAGEVTWIVALIATTGVSMAYRIAGARGKGAAR